MYATLLVMLNCVSRASAKLYIKNIHIRLQRGGDICCHHNSNTSWQLTLNYAVAALCRPQDLKFADAAQKMLGV